MNEYTNKERKKERKKGPLLLKTKQTELEWVEGWGEGGDS